MLIRPAILRLKAAGCESLHDPRWGAHMRQVIAAGLVAFMVACSPTAQSPASKSEATSDAKSGACADGGPQLPGTGLCQADAKELLTLDPDVRTPELEGCTWSVNETMLPADEALLYYAATCKGVTTALGFAGGARSAEIAYETSAAYGDAAKGRVVIRLYGVDPDPQGALKAALAEAPAADRAKCEIRTAGYEGLAKDALIIAPKDGVRQASCGPQGVADKTMRYWRVRQGFAWFFDLGGQELDFDAGNAAIVTKGADGVWARKG